MSKFDEIVSKAAETIINNLLEWEEKANEAATDKNGVFDQDDRDKYFRELVAKEIKNAVRESLGVMAAKQLGWEIDE